jgi:hypothetical protein
MADGGPPGTGRQGGRSASQQWAISRLCGAASIGHESARPCDFLKKRRPGPRRFIEVTFRCKSCLLLVPGCYTMVAVPKTSYTPPFVMTRL